MKSTKSLYKQFNIEKNDIISVVGAGGKTTLIYSLAEELSTCGFKVLVTTTTHIFSDYNVHPFDIITGPEINGKFSSISNERLNELIFLYDIILIESDGSKQLPLKVPASHEPSINTLTNKLIVVGSTKAINHTVRDVCHRSELVGKIFKKENIENMQDVIYIMNKGYSPFYIKPTYFAIRTGEKDYEIKQVY